MNHNTDIAIRMKTYFTVLILFFLFAGKIVAQNPIAQLKFEDAEKAFNAGDYETSLRYIKETEELAGITSKTLFMKTVAQDKLVNRGYSEYLQPLKSNVKNYLNTMDKYEIDEKYRTVYEISKRLGDYEAGKTVPTTSVVQNTSISSNSNTFASSNKVVDDILTAYWKAIMGNVNPESIHSIVTKMEVTAHSTLITIMEKKSVGKYVSESSMNGMSVMRIVYNNGTGSTTSFGGVKQPMSASELERYGQQTSSGKLMSAWVLNRESLQGATVSQGVFNNQQADIIRTSEKHLYFDHYTHLLFAQVETKAGGVTTLTRLLDYTAFQGIKFPVTTIIETYDGTFDENNMNQPIQGTKIEQVATNHLFQEFTTADKSAKAGQPVNGLFLLRNNTTKQGLDAEKKATQITPQQTTKNTNKTVVRYTSVQFNVPIPNSSFE
jgi:hypothetical protein